MNKFIEYRNGRRKSNFYSSTGKTDIRGQEIYYGFHIVKFKWVKKEKEYIFIGVITFDEDELRAEIDIYNYHDEGFYCLWYDCLTMTDFEIVGNVKKNPELIGGQDGIYK